MTNDSFIYSFKVIGLERKQIVSAIAGALGEEVKYLGPPTFAYQTAGWMVDRNGVVTSPEIEDNKIFRMVLHALKTAGVTTEGNGTVTLSLNDHGGNSLRNTINLIWCKQSLIQKALGRQTGIIPHGLVNAINSVPIDTLEEFAEVINGAIDDGTIEDESQLEFDLVDKTISFSFFNASLNPEEVLAFCTLCQRINEQGRKRKFSSIKQREVVNEKYAFRVWLLKLGFIGEAFKTDRKILLEKLTGDGAYRTEEARKAAEEKRNWKTASVNEN
ncbi:MAG: virulence factor [Desulfosporosinus sp.]|nr:virulence factor [Desulfosporosinus sp.]